MKVVIITGASSGIGLASAKAFAAKGDSVVLAARNIEKLRSTVAVLENLHGAEVEIEGKKAPKFLAIGTDVVKEEDCRNLIEISARNTVDIKIPESARLGIKDIHSTVMGADPKILLIILYKRDDTIGT